MIEFILKKVKKKWDFIAVGFLWLSVWATYNTDISRFFSAGFPNNFFDLVHGIRSILPFFALVIALIVLIKNNRLKAELLKGPIGLLGLYTIIGLIASFFSKDPLISFYWGILYGTVIIILLAIATKSDYLKKISFVININLIIAVSISLALVLIFFSTSGAFSFSTVCQFLEGGRPYESLSGIKAEVETFGMAGSRPTGLGRYAGLVAIVMFVNLWRPKKKEKIIFSVLFFVFSSILIFSRARTAIVSFLIAILFIVFFKVKS